MQLSAEDVLDLKREPKSVRDLYGLDDPVTADYGTRCLMARRLVEAGVRFVHVEAPARSPWDSHANLKAGMEQICRQGGQALRRPDPRPQAARAAGRDDRDLGRASSAASPSRKTATAAITTGTPSPCWWPAAVSRPVTSTVRRTTSATRPSTAG